jgi:hypothetical protein
MRIVKTALRVWLLSAVSVTLLLLALGFDVHILGFSFHR